MECEHVVEGEGIGAIFPVVGRPDFRKAVCVTRMVVSEYPTTSTAAWEPSVFRVWLYRTGYHPAKGGAPDGAAPSELTLAERAASLQGDSYDKPVGTMLVLPHKGLYLSTPEPGQAWIGTDLLRTFSADPAADGLDYAVDAVVPEKHITGRLHRTPHVDPNLAATLEATMWELRSRRGAATVVVRAGSAGEGKGSSRSGN